MFSQKIKFIENNIATCAFPVERLSKTLAALESKKINYILIDTRNNYDIDAKEDNKNLNTYEEIFEKAHKNVRAKIRIEKISEELAKKINEEDFNEIIKKVEEIVYETRKV